MFSSLDKIIERFEGKMDPRIKYALELIERNYTTNMSLSQLADKINLSPSGFEHLFKRETGLPYKPYVREKRLAEAIRLLEDLRLSITEIAYKLGYSYLPNFDRDFKRRFGKTPSEYRRKMLAGFAKK